ncbi:hypothetical protein [Nonomuraea sp. NPDC005692]
MPEIMELQAGKPIFLVLAFHLAARRKLPRRRMPPRAPVKISALFPHP